MIEGTKLITKEWMRSALAEHQAPLKHIALAVLKHHDRAEELVSQCTLSALEQIEAGKVRAKTEGQFFAFVRKIVRLNAIRLSGQVVFNGTRNADIQPTAGDRNFRRARPKLQVIETALIDAFQNNHGYHESYRISGKSKRRAQAE
jgi:hypothetical protein